MTDPRQDSSADPMTIYVSIGNSDDKLSQAEWAAYYRAVNLTLSGLAGKVLGQWVSEPASAWQNACWCVEFASDDLVPVNGRWEARVQWLRTRLTEIAAEFRQDSITWAEVAAVELLYPDGTMAR